MKGRIGKYRLVELLGRGGMGAVYLAEEPDVGRTVALKVLPAGAKTSHRKRFTREARATAALNHPHVVPIHEVGQARGPDGREYLYLSMAVVRGGTLADRLEEGVEPDEIASILARVADGLHAAHEEGIVHRDVKPRNVLLETDGRPVVADFGLAKVLRESQGLTRTGQVVGTPHYLSPEQARGDATIDARADVFALGVILYEGLAGRKPFDATSAASLFRRITEREPEPLPEEAPDDLAAICRRAMRKEPGDRYESAAALAEDLRRHLRGEVVRGGAGRRRRVPRPLLVAGGGSLLLGTMGLVAWLLLGGASGPDGGGGDPSADPTVVAAQARLAATEALGETREALGEGDVGEARTRLGAARRAVGRAETASPNPSLRTSLARASLRLARMSLVDSAFERACVDLEGAIEDWRAARSVDERAAGGLVEVLILAERVEEGAEVVEEAPDGTVPLTTRCGLVRGLVRAGEEDRARMVFDGAAERWDDVAWAAARAELLAAEGRFAEAARAETSLASLDEPAGERIRARILALRAEARDRVARPGGVLPEPDQAEARLDGRVLRRRALAILDEDRDEVEHAGERALLRGQLLLALGLEPRAREAFDRAMERGVRPFRTRLLAAEAARRRLEVEEARVHLGGIRSAGSVPPPRIVEAARAARAGLGADVVYDQVEGRPPSPPDPGPPPGDVDPGGDTAGHLHLVRGMEALGRVIDQIEPDRADGAYREALAHLWRAHRRNPPGPAPAAVIARLVLVLHGSLQEEASAAVETARAFVERVEGAPDAPAVRAARGMLLANRGQAVAARDLLESALEVLWPVERTILAWTQVRTGVPERAVETLRPVVGSYPRDRSAGSVLATALERTGQRERARAIRSRAFYGRAFTRYVEYRRRRVPGISGQGEFNEVPLEPGEEDRELLEEVAALRPALANWVRGYIRMRNWIFRLMERGAERARGLLPDVMRWLARGADGYPRALDQLRIDISEWPAGLPFETQLAEALRTGQAVARRSGADPADVLAPAVAAFTYVERVDLGDHRAERGVAAATRRLVVDPTRVAAVAMRARLRITLGDLGEARADLDRAARGTPQGYRLGVVPLGRAILMVHEAGGEPDVEARDAILDEAARAAVRFREVDPHFMERWGAVLANPTLREAVPELEEEVDRRARAIEEEEG